MTSPGHTQLKGETIPIHLHSLEKKSSQKVPDLLVCPFFLTISLGMVSRLETHGDPQFLCEALPDPGCEVWVPVADRDLSVPEGAKHRNVKCGGQARQRDKTQGLAKPASDD